MRVRARSIWSLFLVFGVCLGFSSALSAREVEPRNHLLLMGGEVHTEDEKTYDDSLKAMGDFFPGANWSRRLWFGANGSRVQESAVKLLQAPSEQFSIGSMDRQLEQVKKELADGKIKKGDQYLIVLDTHGGARSYKPQLAGEEGWKIHPVADVDRNPFDVDRVRPLLELLKGAGVRPALLDLSCYSGSTQALADEKTCVISSSDPESVSFRQFKTKLFSKFATGKSLERAFLEARRESTRPALPEISTEEGKKTAEQIRPLYRSLQFGDEVKDELPGFIRPDTGCRHVQSQERALENIATLLKDLNSKSDFWSSLWLDGRWAKEIAVQRLETQVRNYQRKYEEMVRLRAKIQDHSLFMDDDDPKFDELFQKFKTACDKLESEATDVSQAERRVYEFLYEKYSKKNSSKEDPCRSFIL